MFFLIVIGLPAIFFSEIRQKFFSTVVQTAFRGYRGRVWAEFSFGKKHFFIDVLNFSNKKIGVLAKTRLQCCQNCILCVQGTVWGYFEEDTFLLVTFGIWTKSYQTFGGNISASLSKMQSGCRRDPFEKKQFFWEKKLYVPLHRFWTTGPIFSALWQKYSSIVVQTAFYLSIGGVWERLFIGESKFNFHFHKLNKKSTFLTKKIRVVKTAF